MSTNTRNILISCLVLAVVVCLCLGGLALVGGISFLTISSPSGIIVSTPIPRIETQDPSTVTTPTPRSQTGTDEAVPGETDDATPESSTSLTAEVADEMNEIEQQIAGLRQLQPVRPVERQLISPAELRRIVEEDFFEDFTPEEAADDAIELEAFGLLDRDFDLFEFYQDLYSEQIAGFYDDEVETMYVIQGEGFLGPERLTYSHEFVHALQDQTYDLEEGLEFNDEMCEADSERCAGLQALIEGDASLTELQWLQEYATQEDIIEIQEFYSNYESPVYDSAPEFMRESFIFPYQAGQVFVQSIYNQGGWEAVDQVYQNPPISTEQILHPERYPNDQPIPVEVPDLKTVLDDSWRELETNVLGELYTFYILAYGMNEQTRLGVVEAQQAAEGWGGDTYQLYYNDETQESLLVMKSVWDDESEAEEFAEGFREYAQARFGTPAETAGNSITWNSPEGSVFFELNGDETLWVLAPEAEMVELILEQFEINL